MEKLVDQFSVMTEHGQSVLVRVYQHMISASSWDDPSATVPGLKRIVDEQGQPVNYLGEGRYKFVLSDITATGKHLD